jgi:hypothetical protein
MPSNDGGERSDASQGTDFDPMDDDDDAFTYYDW